MMLTREPSLVEQHLDEFFHAYTEAALWSSTDNSDDNGGDPLDENYSSRNFAPDAEARMRDDCVRFLDACATVIAQATCAQSRAAGCSRWSMAGHDFWLTRNRHGCGFWEVPDWDERSGQVLTAVAQKMGEVHLYVGDDGRIYHG